MVSFPFIEFGVLVYTFSVCVCVSNLDSLFTRNCKKMPCLSLRKMDVCPARCLRNRQRYQAYAT